ncbi:hypothetical protein HNY73_020886 [Argiope bruennichi]|uniref:Uncharacterized protein n=1 Tax=Argiope bruennichi TaxID=94029 RepID=A0A8T0EB00_ARGBR|nr:hypothetical protein HNY73_020886 [Argiope bruennichi]
MPGLDFLLYPWSSATELENLQDSTKVSRCVSKSHNLALSAVVVKEAVSSTNCSIARFHPGFLEAKVSENILSTCGSDRHFSKFSRTSFQF